MEAKTRYYPKEFVKELDGICFDLDRIYNYLKNIVAHQEGKCNIKHLYFYLGETYRSSYFYGGLIARYMMDCVKNIGKVDDMPESYYSDIDARACDFHPIMSLAFAYQEAILHIIHGNSSENKPPVNITKNNYVHVIQSIIDTVKPQYDEYVLKVVDSGFFDKIKKVK